MVTVPILGTDLHPYSIHLNQRIGICLCTSGKICIVQQGGHIPAKIKFPVFSLSFPCARKFFSVLFLCHK